MEWQVRIENHLKERLLVNFDPLGEKIIFRGQYSIKNKWINFSMESCEMKNITIEIIQENLLKVYEQMAKRIEVYDDLNKTFGILKLVEIQEKDLAISVDSSSTI